MLFWRSFDDYVMDGLFPNNNLICGHELPTYIFFHDLFLFFCFLNAINCHFKETLKKHFTMRHVQKFIRIIKDYNSIIISARKLKCDVKHLTLTPQSIAFSQLPPPIISNFLWGQTASFVFVTQFLKQKKKVVLVRIVVCVSVYLCIILTRKMLYVGKFSFENEIILWKRITQPYFRYKYQGMKKYYLL